MTTMQDLWAKIDQALRQDIDVTVSLQKLLTQEQKALEQRDYSTFNQLLSKKQELLSQLELHAQQRQQQLQQAGFADDSSALDNADQQAPRTAKLWRTLVEQWQKCQQHNEVNAHIAQRTRQVVSQVMDLIRGQSSNSRTYNAQGATKSFSSGRTISSA